MEATLVGPRCLYNSKFCATSARLALSARSIFFISWAVDAGRSVNVLVLTDIVSVTFGERAMTDARTRPLSISISSRVRDVLGLARAIMPYSTKKKRIWEVDIN